jgi:hypothetical protein
MTLELSGDYGDGVMIGRLIFERLRAVDRIRRHTTTTTTFDVRRSTTGVMRDSDDDDASLHDDENDEEEEYAMTEDDEDDEDEPVVMSQADVRARNVSMMVNGTLATSVKPFVRGLVVEDPEVVLRRAFKSPFPNAPNASGA